MLGWSLCITSTPTSEVPSVTQCTVRTRADKGLFNRTWPKFVCYGDITIKLAQVNTTAGEEVSETLICGGKLYINWFTRDSPAPSAPRSPLSIPSFRCITHRIHFSITPHIHPHLTDSGSCPPYSVCHVHLYPPHYTCFGLTYHIHFGLWQVSYRYRFVLQPAGLLFTK